MSTSWSPRNAGFLIFSIVALTIFHAPLGRLAGSALHNELYSHIVLIPLASAYYIYTGRKDVFSVTRYSLAYGGPLMLAGAVLGLIGLTVGHGLSDNDYLSLMTLSLIMVWTGGFVLFYGTEASAKASFPLLLLIFMIPMPTILADSVIRLLQKLSAEVSYSYFKLIDVPIYREGYVFHLPSVSVEVAKECSGIRSTIALLITSLFAGQLFLRSGLRKGVLALTVLPIAVIKNGLRIVFLSLLGAYVDISYLTDSLLHSRGGIVFFMLALILLASVVWVLRWTEKTGSDV